jgi:hypothetical protein
MAGIAVGLLAGVVITGVTHLKAKNDLDVRPPTTADDANQPFYTQRALNRCVVKCDR